MNIRSIAVASLAALTLVVGLTGCAGGYNEEPNTLNGTIQEPPTVSDEHFTVKYDPTNGRVVKVSNETTSEVLYADKALNTMDETSLLTDKEALNPFAVNTGEGQFSFVWLGSDNELLFQERINARVEIDGKPYPTRTSIGGTVLFSSSDEVVKYYNDNIASLEMLDSILPPEGVIAGPVYKHIRASAVEVAQQTLGYTATILEIRGDETVAAHYANGVPAWRAYHDSPSSYTAPPVVPYTSVPGGTTNQQNDSVTIYAYSFMCAIYEVSPSNAPYTLEEANNLLNDAVNITEIISPTKPILAETVAPCDVISVSQQQ